MSSTVPSVQIYKAVPGLQEFTAQRGETDVSAGSHTDVSGHEGRKEVPEQWRQKREKEGLQRDAEPGVLS